jgi:hypothetical protein
MSGNVEKFEILGLNFISLFNDALPVKTVIIYYIMLQVLNHWNFLKIILWFLLIFKRNLKRKGGGGVKWFFEINFFPVDVMLKKWEIFFLRNWKQLRSNILVKVVSLHMPSNHAVKGCVQWLNVGSSFKKLLNVKNEMIVRK